MLHTGGIRETSGDVGTQTRRVLERIEAELAATGSSLERALAATVYLRSAADFQAMNDAYRAFWPAEPPTRTTVICDFPDPTARVQISLTAAAPGAERIALHPAGWAVSPNPYSYAIRSGDTVYLSGLLARDGRDNTAVDGDVSAQTRVVLDNAGHLLAAAGMTHENIVSARIFMPDLSGFARMNEVYRTYFRSAPPPARATVGAGLTSRQYAVEMTFIASSAPREVIEDGRPRSPNLSTAIRTGRRIYLSGMLGASEDATDAESQARATLAGVRRALAAAGVGPADVVEEIVYLADVRSSADVDAVRSEFFGGRSPASSTVQSALAVQGGLVEIMMTAETR